MSKFPSAANGVVKVGEGAQGVYNWSGIDVPPDLNPLKKQLTALVVETHAFLAYVSTAQQEWMSRRLADTAEVLKARSAIRSKLSSDSFMMHDLAKISVIGYLDDPAKDVNVFHTNMQAIRTFLTGYPEKEPLIKLRQIDWSCATQSRCNAFEANTRPREILLKSSGAPLYMLAPLSRQLQLPMFGIADDQFRTIVR